MLQFFFNFKHIINQITDTKIKNDLSSLHSSIHDCGNKMASATKFIDFFVHDILDYTMLNRDDKTFVKNNTIFNIETAVEEIITIFHDKVTMKQIHLKV